MKTLSSVLAFTLPALLALGCDADSPMGVLFTPPECVIDQVQWVDGSPGSFAKIVMTVRNTGDGGTAFSTTCGINLKVGNTIIERNGIGFGDLRPGESCRSEAWITEVNTQSEFTSAEYHLYWYDSQGGYHD